MSHASSSFLGLLARVQTPPPLKKIGDRKIFFWKGGAVVHRLGPTGRISMGLTHRRKTAKNFNR